jgi:hypothetical protein
MKLYTVMATDKGHMAAINIYTVKDVASSAGPVLDFEAVRVASFRIAVITATMAPTSRYVTNSLSIFVTSQ